MGRWRHDHHEAGGAATRLQVRGDLLQHDEAERAPGRGGPAEPLPASPARRPPLALPGQGLQVRHRGRQGQGPQGVHLLLAARSRDVARAHHQGRLLSSQTSRAQAEPERQRRGRAPQHIRLPADVQISTRAFERRHRRPKRMSGGRVMAINVV